MEFTSACIMVFARTPIPGQVKTRLIPGVGESAATYIHENLTSHCLSTAVKAGICPVQLWCDSNPHHPFMQQLSDTHSVELLTQTGDCLGERMHQAFLHSLQKRDYCLIAGTDCPALTAGDYRQAMMILQKGNDAVIIPAEDGGYVLLGLRKPDKAVFDGIEWGSDQVLRQTIQRFSELGYSWKEMPALWDVDRPDDIVRLSRQAKELKLTRTFTDFLEHQSGAITSQ